MNKSLWSARLCALATLALPTSALAQAPSEGSVSETKEEVRCSKTTLYGIQLAGTPGSEEATKENCDVNSLVLLPIITAAPETSLRLGVFGIMLFRTPETEGLPQPSSILGEISYTLRNQAKVRSRWRGLFDGGTWFFDIDGQWIINPDNYYGIGPNTELPQRPEDRMGTPEQEYALERLIFDQQAVTLLSIARRAIGSPKNSMYVGIMSDFAANAMGPRPGSILAEDTTVVGQEGGIRHGLGLEFFWDQRDYSLNARNGFFVNARALGYTGFLGSQFDYYRFFVDVRGYKSFFGDNTLAGRIVGNFGGGDMPWYDMAMLGGGYLTRGHYLGRYRDKSMAALMGEYRSPMFWRLRGNLYGSVGTVAPTPLELDFVNSLRYTYGLGVRIKLTDSVDIRVDYALSDDQTGLYIDINDAW